MCNHHSPSHQHSDILRDAVCWYYDEGEPGGRTCEMRQAPCQTVGRRPGEVLPERPRVMPWKY